jgi:hypothetical protein
MTVNFATTAYEKPLAEVLGRFGDREMLFVQPGGNWGDSLIYLGAETLAKRLELRCKQLTYEEFIARPPDHSALCTSMAAVASALL